MGPRKRGHRPPSHRQSGDGPSRVPVPPQPTKPSITNFPFNLLRFRLKYKILSSLARASYGTIVLVFFELLSHNVLLQLSNAYWQELGAAVRLPSLFLRVVTVQQCWQPYHPHTTQLGQLARRRVPLRRYCKRYIQPIRTKAMRISPRLQDVSVPLR